MIYIEFYTEILIETNLMSPFSSPKPPSICYSVYGWVRTRSTHCDSFNEWETLELQKVDTLPVVFWTQDPNTTPNSLYYTDPFYVHVMDRVSSPVIHSRYTYSDTYTQSILHH